MMDDDQNDDAEMHEMFGDRSSMPDAVQMLMQAAGSMHITPMKLTKESEEGLSALFLQNKILQMKLATVSVERVKAEGAVFNLLALLLLCLCIVALVFAARFAIFGWNGL